MASGIIIIVVGIQTPWMGLGPVHTLVYIVASNYNECPGRKGIIEEKLGKTLLCHFFGIMPA
jgi:hypothetical protein